MTTPFGCITVTESTIGYNLKYSFEDGYIKVTTPFDTFHLPKDEKLLLAAISRWKKHDKEKLLAAFKERKYEYFSVNVK